MSPFVDTERPFVRRFHVDRDELVAARWWHEGMQRAPVLSPVAVQDTRRAVLFGLGASAAALLALWSIEQIPRGSDLEDVVTMDALEAQRRSGWDVGASGAHLTYDVVSDVDSAGRSDWGARVDSLPAAIAPSREVLLPYFVPTLFQVLTAPDFRRDLAPIHSRSMDRAEQEGRALKDLFRDQDRIDDTALLIDASGPDAVAAAAAVADRFEPVFLFDNWPHPRGVVPSHDVIAAALYYRPAFEAASARRPAGAPPAFVVDSRRLNPYRDESEAFDNRYLAKIPGPEGFQRLGTRHLLYVSDVPVAHEPDDLNDDFVALGQAGIDVKMVALSDFRPASPDGAVYSYGGAPAPHVWFWHSYGWYTPTRFSSAPVRPPPATGLSTGAAYWPAPRPTIFSSRTVGGLSGIGKQKPSGFGRVSLRTSRATGAVSIGRSGSLGRSRSSWYGG